MILTPQEHREYLKWKRKNVTYRGMKEAGVENGGAALFGQGLYTAALSNKQLSREYGVVYFAVNARPKKPKKFRSVNECEIWLQDTLYKPYGYDQRKFTADGKNIKDEMLKLGFDGIEIVGREIVNYTPSDTVRYFKYENDVIDYYINFVKEENLTK